MHDKINSNITLLDASEENIEKAANLMHLGGIVSSPTETVYALGCSCFIDESVNKIYEIKKRPKSKSLIVHFGSIDAKDKINIPHCIHQIQENFITNEVFDILAKYYIPGPLTLILDKKNNSKISKNCNANSKKLAFRVPNNIIAQKLLHAAGPAVAPSANISNAWSPVTAKHVAYGLKDITEPITILDGGNTPFGIESTILDISDPNNITLLRYGTVSVNQIQSLGLIIHKIQIEEEFTKKQHNTLYQHTKLRLNANEVRENEALLAFGEIPFKIPKNVPVKNLSLSGDTVEAAQNLFEMLWDLERNSNIKCIAIMPFPEDSLGIAINNKLKKISTNIINK